MFLHPCLDVKVPQRRFFHHSERQEGKRERDEPPAEEKGPGSKGLASAGTLVRVGTRWSEWGQAGQRGDTGLKVLLPSIFIFFHVHDSSEALTSCFEAVL